MIIGIGTDIVEIERIKQIVLKHSRFTRKYFTLEEIQYFETKKNSWESVAGYFAAKEAVSKSLGTGFSSLAFKDIEICKDNLNKPYIVLHDEGINIMKKKGIDKIHISISHSKLYAVANAIAERINP